MNISRKWLADYVALDCDNATFCEKLTMAGIEVEKIESTSIVPEGVVAAKILERKPHPDSDHMSICKVFNGKEELQIVCGAPNCDAGKIVPMATIGTIFHTPEGDFKIKKSKLRGVESYGMLCSEEEIGVGSDNSGLLILGDDVKPGTPLGNIYVGDTKIEVEVTPNRPDWLCMWGIARDVSCLLDVEPVFPEIKIPECDKPAPGLVTVEATDLCQRYIGRVIRGVKIGPSPDWMVERLESVGLRSINNVVDVTNFVMLELGQPLHAFDLSKLTENRVVVRRAKDGEEILLLDGKKVKLNSDHLVIADAIKPMALAGVMGGENSGVSDTTCDILLESAVFLSSNIRTTSRKLGISSDSSYRFERGVDYDMTEVASKRAIQLILATAGGYLDSAAIDIATPREPDCQILCRFERIRSLIGTTVSNERIVEILKKLHFGIEDVNDNSCVVIGRSFRKDVSREADLAEEVARIDGLDKIAAVPVTGKRCQPFAEDAYAKLRTLRDIIISLGFDECVHYSIIGNKDALFDGRFEEKDLKFLKNPLNPDVAAMRPSLFCGLLGVTERNFSRGTKDLLLFELGKVFCANAEKYPEERHELAMVLTGRRNPERYGEESASLYDFYDMKGIVEIILEKCGLSPRRYRFVPYDERRFKNGRSVKLEIDGKYAGAFGEVSKEFSGKWKNVYPVFVAQIEATALWNALGQSKREYKDLPVYPGTTRDVAMIANSTLRNDEVIAFISKCKLPNLESVRLFDIFVDDALTAKGCKSIAYTLYFRNKERTLTDVEVNAAMDKLRERLTAELKVELR